MKNIFKKIFKCFNTPKKEYTSKEINEMSTKELYENNIILESEKS